MTKKWCWSLFIRSLKMYGSLYVFFPFLNEIKMSQTLKYFKHLVTFMYPIQKHCQLGWWGFACPIRVLALLPLIHLLPRHTLRENRRRCQYPVLAPCGRYSLSPRLMVSALVVAGTWRVNQQREKFVSLLFK